MIDTDLQIGLPVTKQFVWNYKNVVHKCVQLSKKASLERIKAQHPDNFRNFSEYPYALDWKTLEIRIYCKLEFKNFWAQTATDKLEQEKLRLKLGEIERGIG